MQLVFMQIFIIRFCSKAEPLKRKSDLAKINELEEEIFKVVKLIIPKKILSNLEYDLLVWDVGA